MRATEERVSSLRTCVRRKELVTRTRIQTDSKGRSMEEREDRGVREPSLTFSFLSFRLDLHATKTQMFMFLSSLLQFHSFIAFIHLFITSPSLTSQETQKLNCLSHEQLHPHKCSNISVRTCFKSFPSAQLPP